MSEDDPTMGSQMSEDEQNMGSQPETGPETRDDAWLYDLLPEEDSLLKKWLLTELMRFPEANARSMMWPQEEKKLKEKLDILQTEQVGLMDRMTGDEKDASQLLILNLKTQIVHRNMELLKCTTWRAAHLRAVAVMRGRIMHMKNNDQAASRIHELKEEHAALVEAVEKMKADIAEMERTCKNGKAHMDTLSTQLNMGNHDLEAQNNFIQQQDQIIQAQQRTIVENKSMIVEQNIKIGDLVCEVAGHHRTIAEHHKTIAELESTINELKANPPQARSGNSQPNHEAAGPSFKPLRAAKTPKKIKEKKEVPALSLTLKNLLDQAPVQPNEGKDSDFQPAVSLDQAMTGKQGQVRIEIREIDSKEANDSDPQDQLIDANEVDGTEAEANHEKVQNHLDNANQVDDAQEQDISNDSIDMDDVEKQKLPNVPDSDNSLVNSSTKEPEKEKKTRAKKSKAKKTNSEVNASGSVGGGAGSDRRNDPLQSPLTSPDRSKRQGQGRSKAQSQGQWNSSFHGFVRFLRLFPSTRKTPSRC